VALEREFSGPFVRIHRNCWWARGDPRFERTAARREAHWQVVLDGFTERLPVSRRQWPIGARAGGRQIAQMSVQRLVIATRASRLALWQAGHVKERLEALHPGMRVELLP